MNGIELARILAAERPGLKVLLISAYDEGLLVLEQGAGWNFLAKPFLPSSLAAAVETALAKRLE
jgi:DNA-binding NtrC family response regulator